MLHNCKTLAQVVDSLYCRYRAVERRSKNLIMFSDFNKSVIIMNTKTGKHAIAQCDKSDVYDFRTGVAIAWARYNHINPRWEEKGVTLSHLRIGDMFTREYIDMNLGIIGEVTYVIQDYVDGYAYCRKACSTENGPMLIL